jgi:hypothetical protein
MPEEDRGVPMGNLHPCPEALCEPLPAPYARREKKKREAGSDHEGYFAFISLTYFHFFLSPP